MHVVVVGCGRVGSGLARTLEESGHTVAVVDRRRKAFERLPEDFGGKTVLGVGFDRDRLRAAGIEEAALVSGRTLLHMARGDFSDPDILAGSKALMRRLIQHYLGGQVLQSRRVFTELIAFPGEPS